MKFKGDYQSFLLWARRRAAELCADFDHMPPVNIELGNREEFERLGIQARYTPDARRLIEFSPGGIDRHWNEKYGYADYVGLEKLLVHEMTHGWVHWMGLWSDFAQGHNEWYVWKAHQFKLGLPATRHRWPEVIPFHEEVKNGWHPGVLSFGDWRALVGAARGLDPCRYESTDLVANGRVIAGMEAKLGPDGWRKIAPALERCNPEVANYRVIMEVAAQAPCNRWHLIKRALRRWSVSFDESELAGSLGSLPGGMWRETIRKWCRAAVIMEGWEALNTGRIEEEYESVRPKLLGCAWAVALCGPLFRLVEVLKERFDAEGGEVPVFVDRAELRCWDEEESHLYCESTRFNFLTQEPRPSIYEFFRLVLAC